MHSFGIFFARTSAETCIRDAEFENMNFCIAKFNVLSTLLINLWKYADVKEKLFTC